MIILSLIIPWTVIIMAWQCLDGGVHIDVPRASPKIFGRDRTNLWMGYGKDDQNVSWKDQESIPVAANTPDEIISQMAWLAYSGCDTPENHGFSDNAYNSLNHSKGSIFVDPGSDCPPSLSPLRSDYSPTGFNNVGLDNQDSDDSEDFEDSFDGTLEVVEQKLAERFPTFTLDNPVIPLTEDMNVDLDSSEDYLTIDETMLEIINPFVVPSTGKRSTAKTKSSLPLEVRKARTAAYRKAFKLYPKKENETDDERLIRLRKVWAHSQSLRARINPAAVILKASQPEESMDPNEKTAILQARKETRRAKDRASYHRKLANETPEQIRKARNFAYDRAYQKFTTKKNRDNETPEERQERLRKIREHTESLRANMDPVDVVPNVTTPKTPQLRLEKSMDPIERAAILQARLERRRAKERASYHRKMANETPEQEKIRKARNFAYQRAFRLFTNKTKEKENETPEERQERLRKIREHAEWTKANFDLEDLMPKNPPLRIRASMDPETKAAIRKAQRERMLATMRAYKQRMRENKKPEERPERLQKIREHTEFLRANMDPVDVVPKVTTPKSPQLPLEKSIDPIEMAAILQARLETRLAKDRASYYRKLANKAPEQEEAQIANIREEPSCHKQSKTLKPKVLVTPNVREARKLAYHQAYQQFTTKKNRKNETPEERHERLRKIREHAETLRANIDPVDVISNVVTPMKMTPKKKPKLRLKKTIDLIRKAGILQACRIIRLKKKRQAYAHRRRANETPKQRKVRFQKRLGCKKQKLANEVPEQREARIAKKRKQPFYHKQSILKRKTLVSPEVSRVRSLAYKRAFRLFTNKKKGQNETPDEREERLRNIREHAKSIAANMDPVDVISKTPIQLRLTKLMDPLQKAEILQARKVRDLANRRAYIQRMLAKETPEQREARLAKRRKQCSGHNQAKPKTLVTPEVRRVRSLAYKKAFKLFTYKKQKQNETPEEREERLRNIHDHAESIAANIDSVDLIPKNSPPLRIRASMDPETKETIRKAQKERMLATKRAYKQRMMAKHSKKTTVIVLPSEVRAAKKYAYHHAYNILYPKRKNETPDERKERLQKVGEYVESNGATMVPRATRFELELDPSTKSAILCARKARKAVYDRASRMHPKKNNETPEERVERLRKIRECIESGRVNLDSADIALKKKKNLQLRLEASTDLASKAAILNREQKLAKKRVNNRLRMANETPEQREARRLQNRVGMRKLRNKRRIQFPEVKTTEKILVTDDNDGLENLETDGCYEKEYQALIASMSVNQIADIERIFYEVRPKVQLRNDNNNGQELRKAISM